MSTPQNQVITPSSGSAQQQPPMKVVIAIAHNGIFHASFALSLLDSVNTLVQSGRYSIVISPGKSSHVGLSRLASLGYNVLRGKDQKPFNGSDYDCVVFLDTDVVFSPISLIELIESTKIHPAVYGYYMMADAKHFAVVKDWDTNYFAEHGTFPFLESKDLQPYVDTFQAELEERKRLLDAGTLPAQLPPLSSPTFLPIRYGGLGFSAFRKEVLDQLPYPPFQYDLQKIKGKNGRPDMVDMCSEDVAFGKHAEDAGFTLMLNTRLRVGHEKNVTL